jgi:predicted aldo/keto reductase-like oxidoreductase
MSNESNANVSLPATNVKTVIPTHLDFSKITDASILAAEFSKLFTSSALIQHNFDAQSFQQLLTRFFRNGYSVEDVMFRGISPLQSAIAYHAPESESELSKAEARVAKMQAKIASARASIIAASAK